MWVQLCGNWQTVLYNRLDKRNRERILYSRPHITIVRCNRIHNNHSNKRAESGATLRHLYVTASQCYNWQTNLDHFFLKVMDRVLNVKSYHFAHWHLQNTLYITQLHSTHASFCHVRVSSFWRTSLTIPTWPSKNLYHNSLFGMKSGYTTSILSQNNKACNGKKRIGQNCHFITLHNSAFFHFECR